MEKAFKPKESCYHNFKDHNSQLHCDLPFQIRIIIDKYLSYFFVKVFFYKKNNKKKE